MSLVQESFGWRGCWERNPIWKFHDFQDEQPPVGVRASESFFFGSNAEGS